MLHQEPEATNGREETLEVPGIKTWNKEPRLEEVATSGGISRKALVLVIVKRIAGYSVKMRKTIGGTLWRGLSPPKRKKRLHTE
jgi:hypothetical protein